MTDGPQQQSLFADDPREHPAPTRRTPRQPAGAGQSAPPAPPPRRLYLTADLRAATGLGRTAMDFYLRTGVVRPSGHTESGYLLFDEEELTLLRQVVAWRSRGISLKEIKAYIGRENGRDERATGLAEGGSR